MAGVDIATLALKVDTRDLTKMRTELDRTTKTGKNTDDAMKKLGNTVKTALGSLAIGAAIKATISTFADLETRLVAVQKTTDFTGMEMEAFKGNISNLAREVPVATTSLLDIAGVAGQLGIKGVDNITAFTETMGKLSLATDIAGDEGAASIARLLNVTGEGIETVGQFGSVLVALGNNSAATESEILSLATEVGQATSTFSVTAADTAALGAAMKSMGVSSELGGSVVGRTMRAMEDAINAGGNQLQYLSDITGIAAEDLKSEFGDSATAVFQQFVEGVGSLVEQGDTASSVLDKFGLSGEEVLKVLPTMAVNSDQLGKALGIANDELERGSALDKEVANASTTLNAQWQLAKNIISDYSATIGEQLAPFLKDVISGFKDWAATSGDLLAKDIAGWVKGGVDVVRGAVGVFQELDIIVGYFFGEFNLSWSQLTYLWELGTLSLKSSFSIAFDDIRNTLAHNLNVMGDDFGRLPIIGEDIREKFRAVSEDVKGSGAATAEYAAAVAKLDAEHNKEIVTIKKMQEALLVQKDAALKVGIAEEETAKKAVKSSEVQQAAAVAVAEKKEEAAARAVEVTASTSAEQKQLSADLKDRLMQLTEEEHDYKLWTLEQEVAAMRVKADGDKAIEADIAEYSKLKQDEILEDYKAKQDEKKVKLYDTNEIMKELDQAVVTAFVEGENVKQAVAQVAKDNLIKYATGAANEGLPKIMEGLGEAIGGWVGLGTAESGTDGATWVEKIASGAAYLAQAGAAVLAGKAVGRNFAGGGWLSRNPGGGAINEGSGLADDVLLSVTKSTNGAPVFNMGMGGEFVNNKESTRHNYDVLDYINTYGRNKKLFANGGQTAPDSPPPQLPGWWNDRRGPSHNAWEDRPELSGGAGDSVSPGKVLRATRDITNSGMTTIGTALIGSIFDFGASMGDILGFYGGSALGMVAGKEVGEELFSNGGVVRGFSAGGAIAEAVNTLLSVFGYSVDDIWDELRKLPSIKKYAEMLDAATLPFVADTATPGKHISGRTFEVSISNIMDEFRENFLLDAILDLIPGGNVVGDLLGALGFADGGMLHNGAYRVPKTANYLLQEGERVQSIPEMTAEQMSMQKLAMVMEQGFQVIKENTQQTARVLRRFDTGGLPATRGY